MSCATRRWRGGSRRAPNRRKWRPGPATGPSSRSWTATATGSPPRRNGSTRTWIVSIAKRVIGQVDRDQPGDPFQGGSHMLDGGGDGLVVNLGGVVGNLDIEDP